MEKENKAQIIYNPFENNSEYYYEINKNKYIANSFISLGVYGPISSFYKANTNELVTIKKISNFYENPSKGKNILKQLSILSFLNHPKVIKLIDILIPEDKEDFQDIYLIEEFMPTTLEKLIMYDKYNNEKDYPWIIYQILKGLNYLHSSKIMHRDLRPSNILLNEEGDIKICGFKNATSFDDYENTFRGEINDFTSEKGILTYTAPEILASKKKNKSNYNEKIDLWGVGCIMAELYTKIIPFFPSLKNNKKKWISQMNGIFTKLGKPSKGEIEQFASKERIKDIFKFHAFEKMKKNELFPNVNNEDAINLIERLLCINPHDRISLNEALNHPYFDVIKDYKYEDKIDCSKIFINEYENKIEEMEKRNAFFNEQIEFYKNEILLKKQNFNINYK